MNKLGGYSQNLQNDPFGGFKALKLKINPQQEGGEEKFSKKVETEEKKENWFESKDNEGEKKVKFLGSKGDEKIGEESEEEKNKIGVHNYIDDFDDSSSSSNAFSSSSLNYFHSLKI